MPQEFEHSRDVLSYRASYVLRRPWSLASARALPPQRRERLALSPGWECPPPGGGGGIRPVPPAQSAGAAQAETVSSGTAGRRRSP